MERQSLDGMGESTVELVESETHKLDDNFAQHLAGGLNLTVGHVIHIKMHARHIKKNLDYKRAARRVIFPNSKQKFWWDACNFLLLLYSVFEIPYSVSFLPSTCGQSVHEDINLAIDCFFLTDIAINFFTAYFDEDIGILEVHLRAIARHYVMGWFLFDLASSLPMDRIVCSTLQNNDSNNIVRFIKVFRVIKVFRIIRLLRLAMRLEEAIGSFASKTLRLLKFLGILLFCGHMCACIWHFVIELNACSIPADIIPSGTVTCGCDGSDCQQYNWLIKYDATIFYSNNTVARYLVSVYYSVVTLTTLGYGDVLPTNQAERGVSSALALMGAVMFSFLISNISGLVSRGNVVEVAVAEDLAALEDLCTLKGLPGALKALVRRSARHTLGIAPHLLRGAAFLPRVLRSEVTDMLAADGLGELFQVMSVDTRARLAAVLLPCAFAPGRTVFHALDVATELYWVVKGEVELLDFSGNKVGRCARCATDSGPPQALLIRPLRLARASAVAAAAAAAASAQNPDFLALAMRIDVRGVQGRAGQCQTRAGNRSESVC